MLELLAPEHRVTLLAPAPAAGQPPPPAGTTTVTYRGARPEEGGGTGESLGAKSGLLGVAGGVARAAARGLPLESGLFFSPDLRRQLRRLAPRADLAVLQLVRLALHRDDCGPTPVLIDLIDDLSLNLAGRAAVDRWWLRPALALEARLLARAQRWLAREAAGMLLVCDRDRRQLVELLPAALASRVHVAGLAVEPGAGAASASGATIAAGAPSAPASASIGSSAAAAEPTIGPPRLVFTGNLGYFVNVDAISWWLREVWPALAARRPDAELVVAGDRPPPELQRLVAAAGAAGKAALVGSPPDLRRQLAGAAVALAPMRCGSGVPVKILEAWSRGVPVVASPWAAAGTTGVPGEDLLVAATPHQWVETLCDLLQDPSAQRRLAASGRRRLAADYSRQRVKGQLLAAVAAAVPGA